MFRQLLLTHIPLLQDLRHYDRPSFKSDLQAGFTVSVVLIPQAMAYAMLAGLPPVYGLYAAVFPLLIYALLGSSRHLSIGPAALLSLLIAAGVGRMAEPGSPAYIQWALALALGVGILQFFLGVFRLGFLVNFLSNPVISGFTSASAVMIILGQAKSLMGIELGPQRHFPDMVTSLVRSAHASDLLTIAVGLSTFVGLAILRHYKPRWPGALFAIVYGILLTEWLKLDERGLAVLGKVPGGLPVPSLPIVPLRESLELLPSVLSLSLMGFVISIAVARSIPSEKRKFRLNPNQELIAQGTANFLGSFLQCFPVAGSFARTAVNVQAGAQTGMASVMTGLLVLMTVLLLTPLLQALPLAVLGAIIVIAVAELFQWRTALHLYRTDRRDLLMLATTFLTTLLLGMETGIVTGVALSLSAVLYSSSRPHYAVLGRLPGTTIYKNIERFPEADKEEGVVIIRPDARLYFGNQEYVRDLIENEVYSRPGTELVIVDGVAVTDIDSTAVEMIRMLQQDFEQEGIRLRFIGLIGPVRDVLQLNGLQSVIGSNHVYTRIHDLVVQFRAESEDGEDPRKITASPK